MELHNQIVELLASLPNIHDKSERRALIYSAGLDKKLEDQLEFEGATAQFCQLLVRTLTRYGRLRDGGYALEAILEAAKARVGQDRQVECEALIQAVRAIPKGKTRQNFNARLTDFIFGKDEQREQRNRQFILERVRWFWVKGFLEKSLHKEILIQLDKQEQPGAVQYPWDIQVQEAAEREPYLLPKDKPAIEIFEEMGRALLILGDPGSGKTITLLEIARDAIARAEDDFNLPIPIVFNLSSWAEHKLKLVDWLIAELHFKYQIPKKVAQAWLEHEELLLLLDGLDEVTQESREACVEAINKFRQEHGFTGIVVCSRIEEYQRLAAQLNLQSAIFLQPLTLEQIDLYLANFGSELAALRTIIKENILFQELAVSPLRLSIMVIVYQGVLIDGLQLPETFEDCREQLFDLYVNRMLKRRKIEKRYPPQQIILWLSWLAQKLIQNGQKEFFIENLQPTYLTNRLGYGAYVKLSSILMFCLMTILANGAFFIMDYLTGKFPDICTAIYSEMFYNAIVCVMFGISVSLASFLPDKLPKIITVGLSVTWILVAACFLSLGLEWGLVYGLLVGLPGGIVGIAISDRDHITLMEIPALSWKKLLRSMTVGVGLGGIITVGIWRMSSNGPVALATGLPIGVILIILFGVTHTTISEESIIPNYGIRQSGKHAIEISLAALLLCTLSGIPIGVLCGDVWRGVRSGFSFGVPVGMAVGIFFGGAASIQHIILRLLLVHHRCLPWQLVEFLDYAATLILLRKVGGGYIFIHQWLLEYLAMRKGGDEMVV